MKRLFLLGLLGLAALVGASAPAFAQCPGVNCNLPSTYPAQVRTYSVGLNGLVPTGAATDIYGICGSASRLVQVTKMGLSGRATAAANADLRIAKRSTANSGGTSSTPTIPPLDSNNNAATAVVRAYTDNPSSLGTLVGYIAAVQVALGNLTTTLGSPVQLNFGSWSPAQSITLRGTSQCVYMNLSAGTFSGNTFDAFIEWTEQ